MTTHRLEIIFLLAALGACRRGDSDMSEGPKIHDEHGSAQGVHALGDSHDNTPQDYAGALKNPDPSERARAVRALGKSQDHPGAVRALGPVLRQDLDRDVRSFAARALGQLGGPEATALLVEKTISADEAYVRGAALLAIETNHDPIAILGLISALRMNGGDDNVAALSQASQALVKIGAPSVPQLLQALNDSSASVRKEVVNVLGEIGSPEVADRIAALRADPDPAVRRAVELALAKLKGAKQ
jgi:HEAT repeat protein